MALDFYPSITIVNAGDNHEYGIIITPNEGESVLDTLMRCTVFNPPSAFPVINMEISMSCGNKIFFRTLYDIPQGDVKCSCRNPNHYFVRIGE